MVVLVSTKPRRLLIVAVGGTAITVGLGILWSRLDGVPSLIAGVSAIVVGLFTISFFLAVLVEGGIDRSNRNKVSAQLSHADVTATTSDRCAHCHRPLITSGGVSICATCDQ